MKKISGSAAAVAVAADLAQQLAAAETSPGLKGRIRHSVCKWCYKNIELEDFCKAAKDIQLQSIELLTNAARVFTKRCVTGLEADVERAEGNVEKSLAMCTALAPVIGYDKAAHIAKVAYQTNRTVREVAAELSGLDEQKLKELLDPRKDLKKD